MSSIHRDSSLENIHSDNVTPRSFALKLATYIRDPSTIRVHVKREHGVVLDIAEIEALQAKVAPKPKLELVPIAPESGTFRCGHPRTADNRTKHSDKPRCKICTSARQKRYDVTRRARRGNA